MALCLKLVKTHFQCSKVKLLERSLSMNLAEHCSDYLSVSFNQDSLSLAIGEYSGYQILALKSVDKLVEVYSDDVNIKDVFLVEWLFASNLVALVSLTNPKYLKLYHFKRKTDVLHLRFSNTILAVKLSKLRFVVLLEEELFIYQMKDRTLIHTIRGIPSNVHGICALSSNSENCLLAYPGDSLSGEVQIFDAANVKAVCMIRAHNNPIAALSFNADASKLATASGKGTVIRVFSSFNGERLFEFRRGVARYVNISSLAFSDDSLFLAASSNTETVHVFKLDHDATIPNESNRHAVNELDSSWFNYFSKIISTSSTYLPTQVNDILSQDRAFATIKLPTSRSKSVCAIVTLQNLMRVLVASGDGILYIYNLNTVDGGECTLVRQYRFDSVTKHEHSYGAKETYANATKGKTDESTSDDELEEVTLEGVTGYSDVTESLPLHDNEEFPPMALHCE